VSQVCEPCGARTQLFLCHQCTRELRDILHGLSIGWEVESEYKKYRTAGALEWLEDARLGRTRLGESSRQSGEKNSPLVVRLGADYDWKNSPLERLRLFHNTMSTWIRHLCESRGTVFQPVQSVPVWFVGPLRVGWRRLARDYHATSMDCAEWLANHVDAIACDPAAAELFTEVKEAVEAIDLSVNRPKPKRFCGQCPTIIHQENCRIKEPHNHPHICGTALMADHKFINGQYVEDVEVMCPICKTAHNVQRLFDQAIDDSDDMSFTISELFKTILPAVCEYVPLRTLQHWVTRGRLVPTGFDADGEPRFLLADVRELRDRKPQKVATGSAAHKNKRAS
jgi:hypothetical protein